LTAFSLICFTSIPCANIQRIPNVITRPRINYINNLFAIQLLLFGVVFVFTQEFSKHFFFHECFFRTKEKPTRKCRTLIIDHFHNLMLCRRRRRLVPFPGIPAPKIAAKITFFRRENLTFLVAKETFLSR
jgi:hypothetical protein